MAGEQDASLYNVHGQAVAPELGVQQEIHAVPKGRERHVYVGREGAIVRQNKPDYIPSGPHIRAMLDTYSGAATVRQTGVDLVLQKNDKFFISARLYRAWQSRMV